jgi:hypothetical protein
MKRQMRRVLAIFLVVFFGLGPLTATLEAGENARLPACCRRNGEHHCLMSDEAVARMVQAASGSTPVLAAPAHCPLYPCTAPAATVPVHALALIAAHALPLVQQPHSLFACQPAERSIFGRTHAGRGPPNSFFG